jgi:hypothetical protein
VASKRNARSRQLDPKSLDALIVKARALSTAGHVATHIPEKVLELEKGGESTELLRDLYLKNGKWDEATGLSLRILSQDERTSTQHKR